jgi:nucleoside-diphosphate-sugar epimerase
MGRSKVMHILVTGGTGFLGQHLVRTLLDRQHSVSMVGRNFIGVQDLLATGAIPIHADLRNAVAMREACKGMDVVFHVGALSAAWGKRRDFYAINVAGTRAVLEGCREHGVKRIIYVSSPSVVFEGRDIMHATEAMTYPRRFTSVYARTKKLGEDLVNAASAHMETVILRPKAIFGPGDRTLLPQLLAAARQGRLPQIGNGRNLVDLTYVDNVVLALLSSLDAQAAVGKTYTITNDEHVPLWDMLRQVLRSLDISTDLRPVPLNLALLAATSMEAQAALTGKAPLLTRYTAAILGCTQTYNIEAAQRDLGYTPSVSVAEGVRRTLDALKREAQ